MVTREDGIEVTVAYGTSQRQSSMVAGEFAIRQQQDSAAYALAGLSFDTKFNLAETLTLPWNDVFFALAPAAEHGQAPKLGTLHPALVRVAAAAIGATGRRS